MSTAGKVLVVLNALATLGLILLAAKVAELDRNWGQKIQQVQTDLAKVQQDVTQAGQEIDRAKADINLVQQERAADLLRLRTGLSDLQKVDSFTRETLDRFTLQLTSVEAQLQAAQKRQNDRQTELTETQNALNTSLNELSQLVQQNNDRLGELNRLRSEFLETLAENRALVQRLLQGPNPETGGRARPRTRTASMVR